MISIYFIVPIETRLVTHFSGCKTITLHKKSNFICFEPRFSLFRLLKYYKILQKYSFCIGYSKQLFILFVLRKKHQNFYYIYLLKHNLLQMAFKIFLSWFQNLSRREKIVARPSGHLQLFRYKVSTNSVPKRQLSFIPYCKVIGLTNYKLKISNYQLKVQEFSW